MPKHEIFGCHASSSKKTLQVRTLNPDPEELYKSRVCTKKICGFSCGTLPQMTALGGVLIALGAFLTCLAGFQSVPIFLIKAVVGLLIAYTALLESVDGTKITAYLLNMLFLMVMFVYIPFTLAYNPPESFLSLETAWALSHLAYIAVMVFMHYSRTEMKEYSNYWLLRRFPVLHKGRDITENLLSKADCDKLRAIPCDRYENLVLAGGGAKGLSAVAALYALEQAGMLENIKRFCGTSVGADLVVMFASGMSVEEAMQIIIDIDLDDVVPSSYLNIFGFLFYCIPCRIWMRNSIPGATRKLTLRYQYILKRMGCDENITLSQFQERFGTKLAICVTNSSALTTEFLTAETQPEMPVYLAMRATSAIPGVFLPVLWKGAVYVDGGIAANYPIWAYDGSNKPSLANKYSGVTNERTIGISFGFESSGAKPRKTRSSDTFTRRSRNASAVGKGWSKVRRMYDHQILRTDCQQKLQRLSRYSVSMEQAYTRISVSPAFRTNSKKHLLKGCLSPRQLEVKRPSTTITKAVSPPPVCVMQHANYPSLADVFGPFGLGKMLASTLEYMWRSQDRPQDASRTILIDDCPIGTLEFSVSRDKAKTLEASVAAVRTAVDYLTSQSRRSSEYSSPRLS